MNKRIRKKKGKTAANPGYQRACGSCRGNAAGNRNAGQDRHGISYIKYIEAVRERQYGIMPVYHTTFWKRKGA